MERRSGKRKILTRAESSLSRGLRIIEALAAGSEVSLGMVASASGMSKSTVHRLLRILVANGWAEQSGSGLYAIGARALEVGGLSLRSITVTRRAAPALSRLRRHTPETIHLAVLRANEAVYVDKLDGQTPYQMASRVGKSIALYSTAIGKSILAYLPADRLDEYLRLVPIERLTPKTAVDPEELRSCLEDVRSSGYSIDDEENEPMIRCVGAPIFDARGIVIGGVSVSAPTFRLSIEEAQLLGRSVASCAQEISVACGAQPGDLPPAWSTLRAVQPLA